MSKYVKIEDTDTLLIDGDRGNNYPSKKDFFPKEYCLFLDAGNITENGFDFSKVHFITREKDNKLRNGKIQRNDIIMMTRGSVGNVALYDENVQYKNIRINSGMVIIRAQNDFSALQLYYMLKSRFVQEQIMSMMSGSVQKQLPVSIINKINLIKKRIDINIIKKLDDKISNNNKIISELEKVAKTIYDYWFLQYEFPNEEGKPYKSSGGKVVWNEKIKREIPDVWNVGHVEDYCNIFVGNKDVNQSKNSGKYKFYSCSPDYRYSDDLLYQGKAIIISGNGSYTGRTIYIDDAFDLYQRTYACVGKKDSNILVYIFYSMLRFFVPKVSGGTHGSTIPYIVYDDIAKHTILYNYNVVKKFVDKINPIQDNIIKLNRENEVLSNLKNFLLPLLMNGQVGFKNDEKDLK